MAPKTVILKGDKTSHGGGVHISYLISEVDK